MPEGDGFYYYLEADPLLQIIYQRLETEKSRSTYAVRIAPRMNMKVDSILQSIQRMESTGKISWHTADRWCAALDLHLGLVYGWDQYWEDYAGGQKIERLTRTG